MRSTPDVFIHCATCHAVADDTAGAVAVLHAAEAALAPALEAAASAAGDELLVLRHLDLCFAVDLDGGPAPLEALIERAMTRAIRERITRARSSAPHPVVTEDLAWFPDEATAIAEHLAAIAEGRASSFPYRLFASSWGATWSDVLRACIERGRVLLGAVLAHTLRRLGAGAIIERVLSDVAAAIVEVWTRGGSAPVLAVDGLPADVREAIFAAAAIGRHASHAHRELLVLAELFARWPPARELQVTAGALRRLARAIAAGVEGAAQVKEDTRGDVEVEIEEDATPRTPVRRISTAGGLLLWETVLDHAGLRSALAAAYPDSRAHRAARWAIGRALEDPRVDGTDPLLLLWSGEEPTALVEPTDALRAADPEPLHRLAISAARDLGCFAGPLDVALVGDLVMVMSDGFCVDAVAAANVHDAVPDLVVRFSRRAGAPPAGVRVADRFGGEAIDALLEVDVPALPEAWRPAVRAFASLARHALIRRWRAPVRELRRWTAVVELGNTAVVELSRSDIARVGEGAWLKQDVCLLEMAVKVRTI